MRYGQFGMDESLIKHPDDSYVKIFPSLLVMYIANGHLLFSPPNSIYLTVFFSTGTD